MEADHLQSLVIFLQNSPFSSSSSPSWQFGAWSQWSRTAPRQPSAPHRDATDCCCLVTVSTSACIHICICISMCTLCLFLPAWYNIVLSCLDTMRYKEITVSPLKPKTVYNCIIWKIANNSLGTECLQKQEPAILLSHTGRLNEVNSKFRFASSANHQKGQGRLRESVFLSCNHRCKISDKWTCPLNVVSKISWNRKEATIF